MEPERLRELADDIRERGLIEPIDLYAGEILDGRNRHAACEMVGAEPRFREVSSSVDPWLYVWSKNGQRRDLAAAQRYLIWAKLAAESTAWLDERERIREEANRRRSEAMADNKNAAKEKEENSSGTTCPATVSKAKASERSGTTCPATFEEEGDKHKTRSAAATASGTNKGTVARMNLLMRNHPDLAALVMDGTMPEAVAMRETRRKIDTEARQTVAIPDVADATGEGWSLYAGDFSKRLMELEPGSVTLIVTDPPYPAENLPLWRDLAECAKRVLCPGGVLLGLTGQIFLPDVMRYLGEFLDYGWTYAQPLPGSHSRILGRHITQAWKPWLAYSNGPWPSGRTDWHDDLLTPGTRSKDKYHWQQDPAPVADLIDKLAPPGSIVCDPFSGTGAYGALCLRMGRRFIGCELDAGRFDLSRKAMEEASLER